MAITKRLLTPAALKSARESGTWDADLLAFYEGKVKNEIARQKARRKRVATKKLRSQRVTGDAALIALTTANPTVTKHKNKLKAEKLANEERKDTMEYTKLRDAGLEVVQRATQPRPKRRSPRTGLAKFGLTL